MSTFVRRSLFALIAFVLMSTVALSGFYNGAQTTPTLPTFTTTEPTVASEPTVPVDVWQPIRGCDLAYAKVEVAEVPVDDTHPESFDGSNTSEVWETYVFGDQSIIDSVDTDRLNDRWGNPITKIIANSSLDAIPTTASTVWVYNEFGYLAGWDGNSWDTPSLIVTGFCHAVEDPITWTQASELTALGEYSFTYPTEVKNWANSGFTVEVFAGKKLSSSDIDVLDFQTNGLREGTYWAGLGFVGPSSSSHGLFSLSDQNILVWDFKWSKPDYDISDLTGISLPEKTEIVIKTTYVSGETFLQRFVLVPGNYPTPDMIEPLNQPTYSLP